MVEHEPIMSAAELDALARTVLADVQVTLNASGLGGSVPFAPTLPDVDALVRECANSIDVESLVAELATLPLPDLTFE